MSTTTEAPPVEAKAQTSEKPEKTSANPQAPPKGEAQPKNEGAAPSSAPKLSNAELKAKAKAEKQARRAQAKASKDVAPGGTPGPASAGQPSHPNTESKGNKAKSKPDGASSATSGAAKKVVDSKGSVPITPPKQESLIPECFSHLSMAKRLPITQADKDVHPAVLTLGQQMAAFTIDESITRLKCTLLAFKKVRYIYRKGIGLWMSALIALLGNRFIHHTPWEHARAASDASCSKPTNRVSQRLPTDVLFHGKRYSLAKAAS